LKFRIGEMPKADASDICNSVLVNEPSEKAFELLAFLLFIGFLAVALVIWTKLDVISWPETKLKITLHVLLIAVFLMPAHELIHAVSYPRCENGTVVVGFWPKKGFLYAGFTGELSKNRSIIVYLSPFILLSLLPLAYAGFENHVPHWLGIVSILNAGFSATDIYVVFLFLRQIPNGAQLRNSGWSTYWRIPQ